MNTRDRACVWAVIPARGGSKGIVGKNLKKIQGRSLIARSIEAAARSQTIEHTIVSTDDVDIAAASQDLGAEVIRRPEEISGDAASSEVALLHALDTIRNRGDRLPDLLVFLQCTAPFLCAEDIDGTVKALTESSADTAIAAASQHGFLWQSEDRGASGVNHNKDVRPRRQERKSEFLEAGSVYVMRVDGFMKEKHRFFGKTVLYEVPAIRILEIDTPDDLARARLLAPLFEAELRAPAIPKPLGGVVFDFDGVMTDDRVLLDQNGMESVFCSRSDGFGIEQLKQANIPMAVVSRERSPVVMARCRKLGIECILGAGDKVEALSRLADDWTCRVGDLIFVGNDLTDIGCVQVAGLGVAVANALPELKAEADLILTLPGGKGAVRELCDIVLTALRAGKR